ncbi:hypothetical protein L9F63_008467, partial [Diploptera punctata]
AFVLPGVVLRSPFPCLIILIIAGISALLACHFSSSVSVSHSSTSPTDVASCSAI